VGDITLHLKTMETAPLARCGVIFLNGLRGVFMRAKRKDKRAITAWPKTPTLAEYYTEAELAEELGVHPRTIWLWRRDGKGPPAFRCSGSRLSSNG
jgi:hypothetical protein